MPLAADLESALREFATGGGHRILDVLSVTRGGRVAIVELKANEAHEGLAAPRIEGRALWDEIDESRRVDRERQQNQIPPLRSQERAASLAHAEFIPHSPHTDAGDP